MWAKRNAGHHVHPVGYFIIPAPAVCVAWSDQVAETPKSALAIVAQQQNGTSARTYLQARAYTGER